MQSSVANDSIAYQESTDTAPGRVPSTNSLSLYASSRLDPRAYFEAFKVLKDGYDNPDASAEQLRGIIGTALGIMGARPTGESARCANSCTVDPTPLVHVLPPLPEDESCHPTASSSIALQKDGDGTNNSQVVPSTAMLGVTTFMDASNESPGSNTLAHPLLQQSQSNVSGVETRPNAQPNATAKLDVLPRIQLDTLDPAEGPSDQQQQGAPPGILLRMPNCESRGDSAIDEPDPPLHGGPGSLRDVAGGTPYALNGSADEAEEAEDESFDRPNLVALAESGMSMTKLINTNTTSPLMQ